MNEQNEPLFTIGQRDIFQNDLYLITGFNYMRWMVVDFDPTQGASKWITPGVGSPLIANYKSDQLKDAYLNEEPVLWFPGGEVTMSTTYEPTLEQRVILDNWEAKLADVGLGGDHVCELKVRPEYKKS